MTQIDLLRLSSLLCIVSKPVVVSLKMAVAALSSLVNHHKNFTKRLIINKIIVFIVHYKKHGIIFW